MEKLLGKREMKKTILFDSPLRFTFSGAILGVLLCAFFYASHAFAQPAGSAGTAQPSRVYSPVYPYEALIAGRSGWAEITFTVDYSGRATFLGTVGASDPDCASALQADIEAIEFLAPRVNGRTMISKLNVRFDFLAQPILEPAIQEVLAELKKPKPAIFSVSELDKKPAPIRQPRPAYPWTLRSDATSGQAEIEFVIDRTGRPVLPRIISATQTDFGWAAVTCVKNWRYQPAMKNGEKVLARLTETVVFDINNSSDMW